MHFKATQVFSMLQCAEGQVRHIFFIFFAFLRLGPCVTRTIHNVARWVDSLQSARYIMSDPWTWFTHSYETPQVPLIWPFCGGPRTNTYPQCCTQQSIHEHGRSTQKRQAADRDFYTPCDRQKHPQAPSACVTISDHPPSCTLYTCQFLKLSN